MGGVGAGLTVLVLLAAPGAERDTSACARGRTPGDRLDCYRKLRPGPAAFERARLVAHLARKPADHRARLGLAVLQRDAAIAGRHFRQAIAGFARERAVGEEATARVAYCRHLLRGFRIREARQQLDAALASVAEAIERDPTMAPALRGIRIRLARSVLESGDFGRAERLYSLLKRDVERAGTLRRKAFIYEGLADIRFRQGRLAASRTLARRLLRAAEKLGDLDLIANARDQLFEIEWQRLYDAKLDPRQAMLGKAIQRLRWARTRGNELHEVAALVDLAECQVGPDAVATWRRCAALSLKHRRLRDHVECRVRAALAMRRARPEAARRELESTKRYIEPIVGGKVPLVESGRVVLAWERGPRAAALAVSLSYLDLLERHRNLRPDDPVRAQAFGNIAGGAFYWISGMLLEQRLVSARGAQPASADIALAFRLLERLRAGLLLDALTKADAARPIGASDPLHRRRREALDAIARAQRERLKHAAGTASRRRLVTRIEGLEARERYLRLELARRSDRYARFRPARLASIASIQAALRSDQALLAFQIANDKNSTGFDAGGSWVTVITRRGARVHRLPERREIEPAVKLFRALLRARAMGVRAAVRLYRDLLAPALEDLPPKVRDLVIIPDGALHHLPFGALRASASAAPVAERYRISSAPSATLWHLWTSRGRGGTVGTRPALVLADPAFLRAGSAGGAVSTARTWELATGERLGRLPRAREEGRSSVASFGRGSRLLLGAQASERFLKQAALSSYGILHFASHALIDPDAPDRSGLLLAPGDDAEDGLLQAREIVGLSLGGQIVVLSGCRTAADAVIRGEGPLGLARAFFQAGAHAVVATLWKVRDEEMAWLMSRTYRHLAAGTSIGEAVARAQLDAIGAGQHPAAWASLVVLGDGAVRPHPGPGPGAPWGWPLGGAALALFVGAGIVLGRRRVARRRPDPW